MLGSNRVIVINGYFYAKEAMVKKGVSFAGRPPHFAGSLFSRGGKGVGFQGYTPRLKLQRKAIIHTIRSLDNNAKLEEMVSTEVEELVDHLADGKSNINNTSINIMASEDLRNNITDAENYIVASLSLGEGLRKGGRDLSRIMESLGVFSESLSTVNIIDAFPLLKYVPFAIIQKLKQACKDRDKTFNAKFIQHKERFLNGRPFKGMHLADVLLEMAEKTRNHPEEDLTDDYMIMTLNDTIIAGSESSASTFCWVIFFLVKYPSMQKRIQEELDDIIGQDCPPKWSNRNQLPYLAAFTTECMRMASAMPLALPHQTTVDTSLGPYKIPKNTAVVLNVYAIHRDEEIWERPHDFNPERFLHQDGSFNKEKASKCVGFGMGHRTCPGELLGRMELFLFVSSLLQKFTFRCRDDLPDVDSGTFGLVYRSPEFSFTIEKRP